MTADQSTRIPVGGEWLTIDQVLSILLVGTQGSGKTAILGRLLRAAVRRYDKIIELDVAGDDARDSIGWEMMTTPGYQRALFDPWVRGSAGLDLAPVLRDKSGRKYLAAKLFQREQEDRNPHFILTARRIWRKATDILAHFRPNLVHLADPIRVLQDEALCEYLGRRVPRIGNPYQAIGSGEAAADVRATLHTRLDDYEVVAALLLHAETLINPLDFEGALTLRWRDRHKDSLSALFSFIIDWVIETRLEQPRSDVLWLFLDELASLERIRGLAPLMRKGRKCLTIPCIAIHEIESMHSRYGEADANEILNLTVRKLILKLSGVSTSKWASEVMGQVEGILDVAPPLGGNLVPQRQLTTRPNVTADELRRLPRPQNDRLVGFVDGPDSTHQFVTTYLEDVVPPRGWKPEARELRPAADQELPAFTQDDFVRLNFPRDDKKLLEFLRS